MKISKIFSLMLLAVLLVVSPAFAGTIAIQEDGTQEKASVRKLNFSTGMDVAVSNGVATVTTSQLAGTTTALTAGAAVTLTVAAGERFYTDTITTDNQDQTITFSGGGNAGDIVRILFITDTGGSNDEVITFHTTLTNSAGTLTLANLTAGRYVVSFMSDGTVWNEISRTAALS